MNSTCTTTTLLGLCLACVNGTAAALMTPAPFPHHQNAYRHIASELQNRRVVALGDFAHQNAYPFYTVTQVLSNWLGLVYSNGGQLVLALEADAQMANVLNQYLKTGDLDPVLEFWLPFSSLDQLEFYGHLRDFTLRLQQVNQGLPSSRQIGFKVVGLEPPSPLSVTNVTAANLPSILEAGQVANERDLRITENLMTHLRENPRDKALVFYGVGHLPIREQPWSWARQFFGSTDAWRTMGMLLKEQLGSNFLSVAQLSFPPEVYHAGNPYRTLTTHDIFVWSTDIPWKHPHISLTDFDAVVFFSTRGMDEPHLLKYICCRRILDRAIARLAFLEQLPKNAFTAKHSVFSTTLAGLKLTTGQSFEKGSQWKGWAATNAYDGFLRMDSSEFADAIRKTCGQAASKQRNGMLSSLGMPQTLATRQCEMSSEQWRDVWPKLHPTVRFLQCVGIYWVGYREEKEKAREFLVQFSGQEFQSPAQCLRWYRKNSLRLTY